MRALALAPIVLLVAACAAPAACPPPAPAPTPEVRIEYREVPVEVAPAACAEVILALSTVGGAQNDLLISLYDAYLDYPNENLTDFGRRAEALLGNADVPEFPANFADLLDACLGTATPGVSS